MEAEPKKKPIASRVSGQRSRAGCSTCKRRRVKCDEGYPHCQRCLKAHLQCEGYSRAPTTNRSSLPSTGQTRSIRRIILPKSSSLARPTISGPSSVLPGETEVENRYLRYFHQETTSGFQSAWDWTLWNRLVMQGCHNEPFIRYAVVAIGALHKSLRTLSPTGQKPQPSHDAEAMAKLHREFAYLTYGKSIKKMQIAIDASADYGPRYALIACLLIVCFESHTGNRYKAITHTQYGLQILQQWNSQSKVSRRETTSAESPKPMDVEDDIIEAFRNLDIQTITCTDHRSLQDHERMMKDDDLVVHSMCSHFENLDTARIYWNVIMRRSVHFLATTWHRTDPDLLTRPFRIRIPGSVIVTVGDTIHTTSVNVDDVVRSGERKHSAETSRWLAAFEPIYLRTRRSGKGSLREYVVGTMLQIQAVSAKITLAGVVFTKETLYDDYLPDFKTIVRLSQDVATVCCSRPDADFWIGSFQTDLGLIVPLFLVLIRCRDAVLRRQAIEILKKWHVECWWDPLLIIAVGRFIIDVEEESANGDGTIPEEARAILTAKQHCPPDRMMVLQCVQRTKDGLKWTERTVKW
ncbi:hypothetical protein BDV96DRAFT_585793 [Lophiotrema nucula]|uniref:Zn(2)-C6 fungal-type domain-containing protein n=1 Tax=Lophiotrema nucula TaxID=690887 RepID=A0A6A5YTV4_9PLEO|nr:hypothetical protein BDV96DRAFT_585793 [Lophiotrema nucula]